ncbi:MAG: hypothetical protein WBF13_01000 [Candidatus Zixiibacteriota bacterium]
MAAAKRCFALLAALVLLVVIIGSIPAGGTTVRSLDVTSLSLAAASVVEGDVVGTRCAWNEEHTQIYTYVTLEVTDVYAGSARVGIMEIRMLGGAVGDTAMIIPGAPGFAKGEHLVLFLHDDPGLYIPVVGLHQGKLSFTVDQKTGLEVVGNPQVGFFDKQELKSLVVRARERR